jgi:hypothetical protein
MKKLTSEIYEKLVIEAHEFFNKNGFKIRVHRTYSPTDEVVFFEPETNKSNLFDGMQLILFQNYEDKNDFIFEVSEYQAGPKQNELHIFKITKSFKTALKSLIKGNNQKVIQKIK